MEFYFSPGAAEGGVDSPTISKGPISFSIKTKDIKKPKIEYRTSVIYKQSCEQGESDEEDINNKDEDEKEVSKDEPDEKANVIETAGKEEQNQTWPAAEVDTTDLNEQMKSIEAAEREGSWICSDEWVDGRMNEWMKEWMNEWMNIILGFTLDR